MDNGEDNREHGGKRVLQFRQSAASPDASDSAAQQHRNEVLDASNEWFAAIIQAAMDAIITVDQQQRIVVFNAAAEKIFGCPAADAIGSSLDRFIPKRFRTAHRDHVHAFGGTGITSRSMHSPASLSALRANGEEFPIEATISRVTVLGQELYTVILRDISQRPQADKH